MSGPTWTWPADEEEVLRRRADRLRAPALVHRRDRRPHLVVAAGGERYALPTDRLSGVVDPAVVTPIPGAEPPWAGLTIVRGRLYPVADLTALLTRVMAPCTERPPVVLLRAPDHSAVGVRVEQTLGTEELALPIRPTNRQPELVVVTTPDLVHVLDVDAIVSRLVGTHFTPRGTHS